MNTNPEIYARSASVKNQQLRSRLEAVRGRLSKHIYQMENEVNEISQALEVKYTDFIALFKKTEKGWECLRIINENDMPEDMEDDWDLIMPIPDPESMPEFGGW